MGQTYSTTKLEVPTYKRNKYKKHRPGANAYRTDSKNVYWRGQIVDLIDLETFQDHLDGYATDSNYIYFHGKKIQRNNGHFRSLRGVYAKDKHSVWFNGNIIDADPRNFKVRLVKGEDGLYIYRAIDKKKIVKKSKHRILSCKKK